MKSANNTKNLSSLFFLMSLLLPALAQAVEFLQSDIPYQYTQSGRSISNQFAIVVPSGSQSLTVTIRNGNVDLDLLVRRGTPVATGDWDLAILPSADAASITDGADETVKLTSSGSPPLTAGTWYIAVVNWDVNSASYTLTATIGSGGPQAGSNGTPAGFTVLGSDGGLAVVACNFGNGFTLTEVEAITDLISQLVAGAGDQDVLTLYPPEQLLGMGYDGTELHEWLLPQINYFSSYTNVVVSKHQGSAGGSIRLTATLWDDDYPVGTRLFVIDIADPFPLEQLVSLLSEGSQYIKVATTKTASKIRFDLYFQNTLSASGVYMASVEISEEALQELATSGLSLVGANHPSSVLPHPGSGGVPAGLTAEGTDGKLIVAAFNFNSQFDMESIDSWFGVVSALIGKLGLGSDITLYSPDQLMGWGYNGTQLHNWLLGLVGDFGSYINIPVSKVADSNGSHVDLRVSMWDATHPAGLALGTVEIGDPLPLTGLLSILNSGNRYIRVTSSQPGGNSLKFAVHFLANAKAAAQYIGGVSITEALLIDIFSSFQQ